MPYYGASEEEDALVSRAIRAYFRWGGEYAPMPSNLSCVETRNGRRYVVLMPGRSPLPVVYRLDPQGILRRLKGRPKWAAEMAGVA